MSHALLALPATVPEGPTDLVECPACAGIGSYIAWAPDDGSFQEPCDMCDGSGQCSLRVAAEFTFQEERTAWECGWRSTRPLPPNWSVERSADGAGGQPRTG